MGVDAIALVSADTKNSYKTVELANDAGIPIFFLYSTPSNTTDAHKIAGKVADSYEMVGYILGEWVAQNYPDAICVNIPGFFGQSKASKQTVGFDKALTDAGMQPAILLESSDWQYDKSIQIANDLLDSGIDFDVVFTCNEYTYQGVNKVFKERGVTSKIIVSTNGHDDYWDDISRGDLSASSPNPPTLLADLCFQQVVAHLNGEDYLSSLKVIPSQIILPENLDAAISWDADLYLQGRINEDFEYDLNYYSSLEYDNRDLILDILRLTVEFMQEL